MKVFQELSQELYKKLFRSFEVPNSRVSRFQTLNFESFEVPNLELSNSRVSRFQTLNFGVSRFQTQSFGAPNSGVWKKTLKLWSFEAPNAL